MADWVSDSGVVAVEPGEQAGAIVYWALSGVVNLEDAVEALAQAGFDESWRPNPPTAETALYRSMLRAVQGTRQLVRPLGRRGAYALVSESVGKDENGVEVPTYRTYVTGWVERSKGECDTTVAAYSPADAYEQAASRVRESLPMFENVLIAQDASAWLLSCLERHVHAITLRERGGMYFVPRDRMDTWRRFAAVVRSVSDHKLYEIPAMRTEEAVAAILDAVRSEAQSAMEECEEYLLGQVSTRGLNSVERRLSELRGKLSHYQQLLGAAMPDVDARFTQCVATLRAARMLEQGLEAAAE